jgi:hypothetical protein
MADYVCIVGLDEPEYTALQSRLNVPVIAHAVLPKIVLDDGQLYVETTRVNQYARVSKLVYHGIFEDDLDFIGALALWGGACLPNAKAMLDCRLKLTNLVKALQFTHFGEPLRGYASPYARFEGEGERVAKWGNWHCGENKARFTGRWSSEHPAIIERFLVGQAVRVVMIGDRFWQIRLEGDDWLKSIHHDNATMMPIDNELLEDTVRIREGFGLEIIANDYIVTEGGTKHLLEVNHIPNVTRFPQLWEAYAEYVTHWIQHDKREIYPSIGTD